MIEKDKVVTLTYDLFTTDADGVKELFEQATLEQPFVALMGQDGLLQKFEEALMGLKPGDDFEVEISFEDAYGDYLEENIIDLPQSVFKVDGEKIQIKSGDIVPMRDQEGNHLNVTVVKINMTTVTVDVNHPLAGYDLTFNGKIVSVRDAEPAELEHGHVHGPDGHHHH